MTLLALLLACSPPELPTATCTTEHAVVSSLTFGRVEDGVSAGFDLDGVVSDGADGTGCDKPDVVGPDGASGVDNAFAGLLPVLEATEAAALEPLVQEFIENGTILLVLEMSGWDDPDPSCGGFRVLHGVGEPLLGTDGQILAGQTLSVADVDELPPVPAFVVQDALVTRGFGFDLDFQIFDAVIQFPVVGGTAAMSWTDDGHLAGLMGGGFVVDDILASVLNTGIDDGVEDLIEGALTAAADLDLDGDGTCEAMSVTLEVDAVPVFLYED